MVNGFPHWSLSHWTCCEGNRVWKSEFLLRVLLFAEATNVNWVHYIYLIWSEIAFEILRSVIWVKILDKLKSYRLCPCAASPWFAIVRVWTLRVSHIFSSKFPDRDVLVLHSKHLLGLSNPRICGLAPDICIKILKAFCGKRFMCK